MTGPERAPAYRVGDIVSTPAGAGMVLAYSRDTRTTEVMPLRTAQRLRQLTRFAPLAEHAQALTGGRAAAVPPLLAELERLAAGGFLVPAPTPGTGAVDGGTVDEPAGIGWLAFPTCDRVTTVHATITSYLANAAEAGRRVPVLVSDDSPDPAVRSACRDMLGGLARRFGSPIGYLGPEERECLAAAVAELSGVPLGVARFACLGDRSTGLTTIGANRNSILWHTAGEQVVMADDDVVCRIAAAPGCRAAPVVSSSGGQLDQREYPDRDTALADWPAVQESLLDLHERWLGRVPLASLDVDADFDGASPTTVRRLTARPGRVAVTLTGIVGDCAWDNVDSHLADGEPLPRSREWSQVALRPTLTDRPTPLFGWCIGLDNRQLLPPFTPIGRAEEVAFGNLLARCFADHYLTYLPWALLHAPPEERAFSTEPNFAIGFNGWIPSILGNIDTAFARDPAVRLGIIGAALVELSKLSDDEFADFVRMHLLQSLGPLVARMEEHSAGPHRDEVRSAISRFVDAGSGALDRLYPMAGGAKALRPLLALFGETLQAWPAMVEAAGALRREGRSFARQIGP